MYPEQYQELHECLLYAFYNSVTQERFDPLILEPAPLFILYSNGTYCICMMRWLEGHMQVVVNGQKVWKQVHLALKVHVLHPKHAFCFVLFLSCHEHWLRLDDLVSVYILAFSCSTYFVVFRGLHISGFALTILFKHFAAFAPCDSLASIM